MVSSRRKSKDRKKTPKSRKKREKKHRATVRISQKIEKSTKRPSSNPGPITSGLEVERAREGAGFKIALERIDGDTVIGDLIVVFPRTRDVLRKHGFTLDVEHAGDIYMTLRAFAALQGVSTDVLIQELQTASREPPPTPSQPQPLHVAAPPVA